MAENVRKAFNVSTDLREKINAVIQASGMEDKEWIESVTTLFQMQHMKKSSPDFNKDINELELHTKRINELVINMVERASFEKDEVVRVAEEGKESKNLIIEGLQSDLSELQKEIQLYKDQAKEAIDNQDAVQKRLEQMDEAQQNNQLLIKEYKEKNDTLTGLVTQYQKSHEENESLKAKFAESRELAQKLTSELQQEKEHFCEIEKNQEDRMHQIQENHKIEMERMMERKDIEKERELLKIRTDFQNQLQKSGQEQSSKIQSLYEKIEQLRSEHEQEIETLKNPKK